MIKYLHVLLLLSIISIAESAEEPSYIEKYLSGKVNVNPGPNWRYYYILAARDETPSQLISLLKNTEKKGDWKDAIQALGILASGENRAVPLSWLIDVAGNWESSSLFDSDEHLRYLTLAYSAVAYQGSSEALDFLKSRASEEYWENHNMPSSIEVIDHPYSESKITARSKALLAIAKHPSPEAESFCKEAYTDPKFSEEYLQAQLESNFRMRSTWLNAHRQRMEAYELKSSKQYPGANIVNEPAAKAKDPIASEVVGPVKKVVASEPGCNQKKCQSSDYASPNSPPVGAGGEFLTAVTTNLITPSEPATEESAEVTTAEPSEEPVEQSSNWWLWLIGSVVVVGGIGLVVRRKS